VLRAYRESGILPNDVHIVELHDCFSANELISYEALGLCPLGTTISLSLSLSLSLPYIHTNNHTISLSITISLILSIYVCVLIFFSCHKKSY
jgi:hypothetical protein